MAWFRSSKSRNNTKKELWVKCKKCNSHVFVDEWNKNLKVCPKCNYHEKITACERIQQLFDRNTFKELFSNIVPVDSLNFQDIKGSYRDNIKATKEKTGISEAVVTGTGKLNNKQVVIAVMDFRFMGGSLGSATGERILKAANYAFENNLPYIIFSASGGARMQEGTLSLMQMAKTCAGISRLIKNNIPYISVLTDPTSGGVSASFAMMGDINISEPGALIAFAGRRVIEQTIREKLPDNFQTAEYLCDHGFIDSIVNRKDMKDYLSNVLSYYNQ